MDVILDTNIYRQDLAAKSTRVAVLLDYLEKTNSRLLLPALVRDELLGLVAREVRERLVRIQAAQHDIRRLLPHLQVDVGSIDLDVDKEVKAYEAYLQNEMRITPAAIIDHKGDYLNDVLARAIARRRPCSDSGEEVRDAVLWLTVLDIAQAAHEAVAFISSNTKQFADASNGLHPDLSAECDARAVTVKYFTTLDAFVRDHATKVTFATDKWLAEAIDVDEVLAQASPDVVDLGRRVLERKLGSDEEIADDGEIQRLELGDHTVYVYEMTDGSFRVEVVYAGYASVVFPVRIQTWHTWEDDYDVRFDQVHKAVDVEFNVLVDAEVLGEKVVEWTMHGVERVG